MTQKKLCVGVITGAYGLRGEVHLKSFCANPSDILTYSPFSTEDNTKTLHLIKLTAIKRGFAAQFQDIHNRNQAELLKSEKLYISPDILPNLSDDEYYHSDLIGLTVLDTKGQEIGKLLSVQDYGAGDILEITTHLQKNPILLPFTIQNVPKVDLKLRHIVINPPLGVFNQPKESNT